MTSTQNNQIDIEYKISKINYNGIMSGKLNEVINNFKDVINSQIISKHKGLQYYIQEEREDNLPSPYSNSNTINFIIPNIINYISKKNKKKYNFKIRIFSNTREFVFYDEIKYPTYEIEIINLNY
jgi:hypothetical protein